VEVKVRRRRVDARPPNLRDHLTSLDALSNLHAHTAAAQVLVERIQQIDECIAILCFFRFSLMNQQQREPPEHVFVSQADDLRLE